MMNMIRRQVRKTERGLLKGRGLPPSNLTGKNKTKALPKGMSIVEFLVVVAVSSVVLIALLYLFSAGQKYFVNQDAKADAIEDSRYPIAWLARDIKEAVEVVPGPVTVNGSSYSTSASCLVLKVPSIDSAGLIIDIENHFDTIVYALNTASPSRLERIVDGKDGVSARTDRSRVVADNVNSLVMTFYDPDGAAVVSYSESAVIEISLISRRQGLGRTFSEGVNTRIKLRNRAA